MGKSYAVKKGRVPGVYPTWSECEAQIKGFKGAVFKSFGTKNEALSFVNGSYSSFTSTQASAPPSSSSSSNKRKEPSTTTTANTSPQQGITLTLHFDGGARQNGSTSAMKNPAAVAGSGSILTAAGNSLICHSCKIPIPPFTGLPIQTVSTFLGSTGSVSDNGQTNNTAEYTGLVTGLQQLLIKLKQISQLPSSHAVYVNKVDIYGDSNLVIKQVLNEWKCNAAHLFSYVTQSQNILSEIENLLKQQKSKTTSSNRLMFTSVNHVLRNLNKEADKLANKGMDSKASSNDDFNTWLLKGVCQKCEGSRKKVEFVGRHEEVIDLADSEDESEEDYDIPLKKQRNNNTYDV